MRTGPQRQPLSGQYVVPLLDDGVTRGELEVLEPASTSPVAVSSLLLVPAALPVFSFSPSLV